MWGSRHVLEAIASHQYSSIDQDNCSALCNCARCFMYNHAIIVTKLLRNFETGQMNCQLERGPIPSFAASSKGFQCYNALNSQQVRFAGTIVRLGCHHYLSLPLLYTHSMNFQPILM